MGIAQGCHDEIATQNWMKWYLKNAGETRPYRSKVSNICENYNIDESSLRHILYYSNFVVGRTTRSMEFTVSTVPATNIQNETICCPTTRTTHSTLPSPVTTYPVALKRCNLSCSNDLNALQSIASIELLVSLAQAEKTSEEIPDLFQRANVSLPISVSIDEVTTLNCRATTSKKGHLVLLEHEMIILALACLFLEKTKCCISRFKMDLTT